MNYTQEVTVSRHSSTEERKAALYQIYAQVLERQPYAFERKQLAKVEDEFIRDKIGVKRFLKALGHSSVYLNEFYYSSSNLKFLELCFKHFIGRAPRDRREMHTYCDVLMRDGVEALITQMIDSEEYRKHFGCFTVPHPPQEDLYTSPKAYLETDILNHELHGQRGKIVPTMVWHELGLTCDGGTCRLEAGAKTFQPPKSAKSQGEFLQMLRSMDPSDLEELASALSPYQREKLRQVLMQPA